MSYVPIVPVVTPNEAPSPQTRELADLLGRVVQEYEKSHPTVTGREVSQALQLARRASTKAGADGARVVVALAFGLALMVGLGVFFLVQQGGASPIRLTTLMAAIVSLVIAGVFVALLKRRE